MSDWKEKFGKKYQGKRVLMVTAGLRSKRSFLTHAFKDMCDTDVVFGKVAGERRIDTILRLLGFGQIIANDNAVNQAILDAAQSKNYDMICVIKGLGVRKSTLETVKAGSHDTQLILWTCDDLALPHNQTKCFINAAPAYDLIFTAKSNNIKYNELTDLGFKRVEFFYQAYCEHEHFPIHDDKSACKDKVLFIGYAENKRFEYMNHLAQNGIIVDVYGNGWQKKRYERRRHNNLILHKKQLIGRDYAQAISNAAINLCFLRELNRDLHTSRTFEIPACEGFMLAERTKEHLDLFKEGEEAEFFQSREELLQKVRAYLDHPEKRVQVAQRGYLRTQQDPYSYHHMAEMMLERVLGVDAETELSSPTGK